MRDQGNTVGGQWAASSSYRLAPLAFVLFLAVSVVDANTEIDNATGAGPSAIAPATRLCVMADDTRVIELVRLNPGTLAPCEVQQRRNDSRETLWRAEHDGDFCSVAYARYLERLSSLGFDCGLTRPPSLDRASAGFE